MPRTKKNSASPTLATGVRLSPETIAYLDQIADHISNLTARVATRSDAIRFAAREIAKILLPKNNGKKT